MLKLIKELGPEAAFDPETLRILTAAFDAAWASIEASGTPLSKADYAEPAREIIGKHIIKAAKNGQRDQQQLRDGALFELARSDLKRRHKPSESPVHDAGRNDHSAPSGQNRLLAALQPADFSLLKPSLKRIVLEQGVLLHEQEDPVEQAYFPQSGMISLLTVMGDGQAIETATVGREGTVGAMSGLGLAHAPSRAVVQVAGTAWVITTSQLRAAVRQSEHFRNVILHYKETLLGQVQQTAGCNALHKAEARLARWLLQTRDRVDSDRIPLTQEFLSEMLGVRRTTVTQVAGALQEAGLIRYRRGHIEIIDRRGLEEAACECYSVIRKRTDQDLPKADV